MKTPTSTRHTASGLFGVVVVLVGSAPAVDVLRPVTLHVCSRTSVGLTWSGTAEQ